MQNAFRPARRIAVSMAMTRHVRAAAKRSRSVRRILSGRYGCDRRRRGRGTLAPSRRASLKPIAMACFRLVTLLPEPPDRNVPRLRSCIARSTFCDAFLLDFAMQTSPCLWRFSKPRSRRPECWAGTARTFRVVNDASCIPEFPIGGPRTPYVAKTLPILPSTPDPRSRKTAARRTAERRAPRRKRARSRGLSRDSGPTDGHTVRGPRFELERPLDDAPGRNRTSARIVVVDDQPWPCTRRSFGAITRTRFRLLARSPFDVAFASHESQYEPGR